MEIKFLQKKPFYIFMIENFLDEREYQLLYENFPNEILKKKFLIMEINVVLTLLIKNLSHLVKKNKFH